ncbi:MAG: tetratricopeptide repeat protein, partial [Alphaproteobacteria bacterium]|nr:tetratricopeptide repeat protein [Alphaproteobacteria bacterium]
NKNGGFLNYLYEDYKKSNEYFAFECLKTACDLGHVGAIISYGNNCYANNDVDGACHWFLKAAEKGNVNAMFNVGTILTNKSKKIDKLEGLKWLLKAAEEGEIDAMYNAGVILRKIASDPVDQIKAFNLFKVASENGQLDAMNALGEMYLEDLEGVGYNSEEAAKCFLSAAEKEDVNGMYLYGVFLKKGFMNQEPNINKGNEWILKAAKKECVAAMNHYGGSLMGWVEDVKEPTTKAAYNWFLKAAKMRDKASMFNVGEMLWWGCGGVKENRQRAKEWLLKSANDGYLDAMIVLATHLLGESYGENLSFKQKKLLLNEAVRLLKIAYDNHYFADLLDSNELKAKKNVLDSVDKDKFRVKFSDRSAFRPKAEDKVIALINFAKLYIQGYVDGQKNIQKAIELILPLAKNNYPEAMDFMGRIFLEVDDNGLNHQKAAKWYKRAAENGYVSSMIKFAKLVILSPFLVKNDDNLKEALFWLQKAELLGMHEARNYLEMCENLLNENAELEISDNEVLEKNDISDHNIIDFKQLNTPIELQEIKIDPSQNNNIDLAESNDFFINVDFVDENNIIVDDKLDSMKSLNVVDENVQQSKNPKYIRKQLRKLAALKKKQEDQQNNNDDEKKELSEKNQLIVNMLLDKNIKSKNVDYTQLVNLFSDPFFENQVSITKSKSGSVITGKNYKTLDYAIASTHKKHAQSYKGLNPFFARDLIEILALFGLKED